MNYNRESRRPNAIFESNIVWMVRILLMVLLDFNHHAEAASSHLKGMNKLRAVISENENLGNNIGQAHLRELAEPVLISYFSLLENFVTIPPTAQISKPTKETRNYGLHILDAPGLLSDFGHSYFALTQEQVEGRMNNEKLLRKDKAKRNEGVEDPLPWSCETMYEWKDMGVEHFPRFIRTAECKSRFCFNGFFRCYPRKYKTKILKRITGADSFANREDDVSLPDNLRPSFRMISVVINICCDCVGGAPGVEEV